MTSQRNFFLIVAAGVASSPPSDQLTGSNYGEYSQYYEDLSDDHEDVRRRLFECGHFVNDPTLTSEGRRKKTSDCLKEIRVKYAPRLTGRVPCVKRHTYYVADTSLLPRSGRVTRCSDADVCEK